MTKKGTLPATFVVVDLETTGLSPYANKIIEIGAIKVINGNVVDTFTTLINPDVPISKQITGITTITNKMVENAPYIKDILMQFDEFISDNIIVGHNVTFDLAFLQNAYFQTNGEVKTFQYIDTLTLGKNLLRLLHHRLADIASYFNISQTKQHRAMADCDTTLRCLEHFMEITDIGLFIRTSKEIDIEKALNPLPYCYKPKYTEATVKIQILEDMLNAIASEEVITTIEVQNLKQWLDDNNDLSGNYPYDTVCSHIKSAVENNCKSSEELKYLLDIFKKILNPVENSNDYSKDMDFNGKLFCLTGDFDKGTKSQVASFLSQRGADERKCVSRYIDYLIVGNRGSGGWKNGNYGNKIKKALELKEKDVNIKIITETNLFEQLRCD